MRYFISICFLVSCSYFLSSCGTPKRNSEPKAPQGHFDQDAYDYLATFLLAAPVTRQNLSAALQPTAADIQSVFADTAAQRRVGKYIEQVFEKDKFQIKLRAEHTELKVYSASVSDFINNHVNALAFPSDFLGVVPKLKPTLTFHRFKFVAKGNNAGAAYDGLVKVNNHWVLFPKIWKAFEEE